MEKDMHYNIGGKLTIKHKFKEINPKFFVMILLKLVIRKRVEKSNMKRLLCSFCNQDVNILTYGFSCFI